MTFALMLTQWCNPTGKKWGKRHNKRNRGMLDTAFLQLTNKQLLNVVSALHGREFNVE